MSKNAGIEYMGKAKDGKLERYRLTVYCGYDSNGKQIKRKRTVTVSGIVEARKKRAEFITEVETGEYVAPSNTTLKIYTEKQYMSNLKKRVSDSTIDTYQRILNNHIYKHIGGYQMDQLTHNHIKQYIQELEAINLASSTINKHYNILNGIFKLAVTNEVIKKNPMDKVDRPSVKYKKGSVYTNDEIKELVILLDKEKNKQMSLLIKLAVTTGMRRGELLALQWDDVKFKDNTINVRYSIGYTKHSGYKLKEPKTPNSIRKVAVAPEIMNELKKHKHIKNTDRIKTEELWKGGKHFFVFSSEFGKPLYPAVPSRWFSRFLERTGFKKVRFHDLRHTHATYLLNKEAGIKDISKRLGHANISTTVDTYGHYDKEKDKKLADLFNDIL